MTGKSFQPGTIVVSKAGRDAGRLFTVLAWDGDAYLWLCDGDLRKVQKPKKKKAKHVRRTPYVLSYVEEDYRAGRNTLDARIRKDLQFLGYSDQNKAFEEKKEG